MNCFSFLDLVDRFGGKIVARYTTMPPERKAHVLAVMASQGALATSVGAPIHNPWLFAARWLGATWVACVALRQAQRYESKRHTQFGRPA
jgi:hypothetical protein